MSKPDEPTVEIDVLVRFASDELFEAMKAQTEEHNREMARMFAAGQAILDAEPVNDQTTWDANVGDHDPIADINALLCRHLSQASWPDGLVCLDCGARLDAPLP